jgi:aminoglycoside phosphotransferase family enzyme/predicted kinase
MAADPQAEILDFLAKQIGATRVVTTHISTALLGRTRVFKVKRAVRLPYLDFSTAARRREMCAREVELNRRFAPALYLGVRHVTRDADGRLALDGAGAFVESAVEMRRFPDGALFDEMAQDGRLTKPLIERLAQGVALAHDAAAPDLTRGGAAMMRAVVANMAASLRSAAPAEAEEIEAHLADLTKSLDAGADTIDARRAHGKVRSCHGDLNLHNICLFEGEPTPFDCLEFCDDMSTIDVLYDLAFLLMDLTRAGRGDLANVAFNRYLDARESSEDDGFPLLPFFLSLRATVRAHVDASQQKAASARAYFDLARALLAPAQPALVAIGGFSGSGKSSVAAALAPLLTPAPGARILNSDRIRKRLFGAAATERLPQAAYAPLVSQKVYRAMVDAAGHVMGSGWPVVVDAVFDRPADRLAIEMAARAAGAPFAGFWLDADLSQRLDRVAARVHDVSDATGDVLAAQMRKETGEIAWRRVDAARPLAHIAEELVTMTQEARLKGAPP